MSFASDCDAVPHLKGASRRGLKALNATDLQHVSKRPKTVLTTSIDVDTALRASQPTAARWDYGVAEKRRREEIVHWIEVHPAGGGNCIDQMHRKLQWLALWLHGNPLAAYSRTIVWVAAGKSTFTARDPKLKLLATFGLRFVGRHYAI